MKGKEATNSSSPFRVKRFDDDVYRWIYELDMYRNPIILITVFKVLGISAAIIFVISLIIQLVTGEFSFRFDPDEFKVIGIVVLVFVAITIVSYFIVAKQYGGKYGSGHISGLLDRKQTRS